MFFPGTFRFSSSVADLRPGFDVVCFCVIICKCVDLSFALFLLLPLPQFYLRLSSSYVKLAAMFYVLDSFLIFYVLVYLSYRSHVIGGYCDWTGDLPARSSGSTGDALMQILPLNSCFLKKETNCSMLNVQYCMILNYCSIYWSF